MTQQRVPPSGEQFEISAGGYAAVVTECGAGLRSLTHAGRDLVDGYGVDAMASGGRGQLLMPWPNRIRDGRYSFDGADYQLPLSEAKLGNASHGLARWTAWSLEEHSTHAVSLSYRLMAQSGYPWTLDLHVLYDLSAEGLTVTQTATNLADTEAPYASGAHPYLVAGPPPVDGWRLHLAAATRSEADEQKIPVEVVPVAGTAYDFSEPRPIGEVVLDHAFTDLERDDAGRVHLTVIDPATGHGVALWGGDRVRWLQLYTADDRGATARRSMAVEPMTANANAFASGTDLLRLAPAGSEGDEVSVSWGVRAVDEGA